MLQPNQDMALYSQQPVTCWGGLGGGGSEPTSTTPHPGTQEHPHGDDQPPVPVCQCPIEFHFCYFITFLITDHCFLVAGNSLLPSYIPIGFWTASQILYIKVSSCLLLVALRLSTASLSAPQWVLPVPCICFPCKSPTASPIGCLLEHHCFSPC